MKRQRAEPVYLFCMKIERTRGFPERSRVCSIFGGLVKPWRSHLEPCKRGHGVLLIADDILPMDNDPVALHAKVQLPNAQDAGAKRLLSLIAVDK